MTLLQRIDIRIKFVLLGVGLSLPFFIFEEFPCDDFARWYGWWIRAFAEGNWEKAFDPRFPPLYFLSSDVFTLFGLTPFKSAQVAMSVCFALAAIPLYNLFCLTHGKRIALWGTALYLLCPRLLRYVDAVPIEPIVWALWVSGVCCLAYFMHRPSWRLAIGFGIVTGALALCKAETAAWALILLAGFAMADLYHRVRQYHGRHPLHVFPLQSITAVALCSVIIMPWGVYVYRQTGRPGLSLSQGYLIEKFFFSSKPSGEHAYTGSHSRQMPLPGIAQSAFLSDAAVPSAVKYSTMAKAVSRRTLCPFLQARFGWSSSPLYTAGFPGLNIISRFMGNVRAFNWSESFYQIFERGLYHVYVVFAVLGAAWLVRRRQATRWDAYLLACITGYFVLYIFLRVTVLSSNSPFVLGRHATVTLPLILGWTATGTMRVFDGIKSIFPKRNGIAGRSAVAAAVCALLWEAYLPIRPSLDAQEQNETQAILDTAKWLRTTAKAYLPPLTEIESRDGYPVFRSADVEGASQIAFRGRWMRANVKHGGLRKYRKMHQFVRICKRRETAMMLWGPVERENFPKVWEDWSRLPPELVVLYDKWKDIEQCRVIIGYRPKLDLQETSALTR